MHSWDVMPANNYDHNWYGGTHIKNESPQEMLTTFTTNLHQTQNMEAQSPQATSPPQSVESDSGLFYDQNNTHRSLPGFNPLTPPGYPGAVLPIPKHNQQNTNNTTPCRSSNSNGVGGFLTKNEQTNYPNQATLTPSHTPPIDDTPPKSPKSHDGTPKKESIDGLPDAYMDSGEDETRSLESDYDDEGIKLMNNSSGGNGKNSNKNKKYKCKQCDYVAVNKLSFWQHCKSHMKPEKMLKCPKCPFVTEYKHHLEYHLRNHDGSKPFQCPNCHYSCVNKSMLNSHLKSHSNIYQYRCTDCNYATKYCHSLKLHLRKYSHKPAMVLNQDGTPNPLPIIDVYGTRRGPKSRPSKHLSHAHHLNSSSLSNNIKEEPSQSSTPIRKSHNMNKIEKNLSETENNIQQGNNVNQQQTQQQIPNLISSMLPNSLANMLHPGTSVPMFPYLNLNFHMLAVRQQQVLSQLSPNNVQESSLHSSQDENDEENDDNESFNLNHQNNFNCNNNVNNNNNNSNNNNNNNNINIHNKEKLNSSALDLSSQQQMIMNHPQFNQSSAKMTNLDNNLFSNDNNVNNHTNNINNYNNNSDNSQHHQHHQHNNNLNQQSNNLENNEQSNISDDEDDEEAKMPTSTSSINGDPTTPSIKNRRKGQAFKLKLLDDNPDNDEDEDDSQNPQSNTQTNMIITKEDPNSTIHTTSMNSMNETPTQSQNLRHEIKSYDCKFCDISFKDAVLYTIHMGYHGYNDVFKCNMCGEKCEDRIAFFLHIARNPHS